MPDKQIKIGSGRCRSGSGGKLEPLGSRLDILDEITLFSFVFESRVRPHQFLFKIFIFSPFQTPPLIILSDFFHTITLRFSLRNFLSLSLSI